MQNMSKEEYAAFLRARAEPSPLLRDMLRAFVGGGLICVLGQLVLAGWGALGLDEESAATATSVTLVFLGALLTGLGVYDDLAKLAGAGTLVPITGFANSVAAPAIEFKTEGFVTGMAVKMFSIAGPVIVFGTVAGVLYGVILVLLGGG